MSRKNPKDKKDNTIESNRAKVKKAKKSNNKPIETEYVVKIKDLKRTEYHTNKSIEDFIKNYNSINVDKIKLVRALGNNYECEKIVRQQK